MLYVLKVQRWAVTVVVVGLVLIGLCFAGVQIVYGLYPFSYRATVTAQARRNGLSPYLVAAVIATESGFQPRITSPKGARGLMQVVPETGEEVAGEIGLQGFEQADLYDPEVNIIIGARYLAELRGRFNGNLPAALAAYNGGYGHVTGWLREGEWDGSLADIESIPFPETRAFVRKVLTSERVYRWLYGPSSPRWLQLFRPDAS